MNKEVVGLDDIKNKIHTIRGKQVILDKDLAEMYGVETKVLNQTVKRNKARFPGDFMFRLNEKEFEILRSQFVTSSWGGRRYLPLVFTEQGVAMLSGVLKSDKSVEVNINIMRAFVAMRKFLSENANLFNRVDKIERKQIEFEFQTNKNFEKVFNLIQEKDIKPEKGIFFDGSVFDAHKFAIELISSAKSSIFLIDNYIDTSVLTLMSHKRKGVNVKIYTHSVTEKLKLSKEKFNKQYGSLELVEFSKAHDRFLIIDDAEFYHIGASLKDLGKRWFITIYRNAQKSIDFFCGFSRLQKEGLKVLDKF